MPTNFKQLLFFIHVTSLLSTSFGIRFQHIFLSPSILPAQPGFVRKILSEHERFMLLRAVVTPLKAPYRTRVKPLEHLVAPSPSPTSPVGRRSNTLRGHHYNHHRAKPHAVSPSPSTVSGCNQICVEPLTSAPYGSVCSCVFPMKVRLLFDVSLYAIFPVVNELEIEVAEGTYLKQSQVVITGASADDQNQERTAVDINLVPLGEKFDNTTATLTYERFWQKKVPLNKTLFGSYDVASITYPGLPSLPPLEGHRGSGPSGTAETQFPITADFMNKSQKMSARTILIISSSAVVVLVVCIGAVIILLKCRKDGRPSNAVGPAYAPSVHRRSGIVSFLSSRTSSKSASLLSVMPTSLLSVKTFSLAELDKATDNFNSKRVLGEGGFGRVYHGILEDRSEIAVKLLTRDSQNGDREFIAEVEMLSRLHHRNLVKLIGICIEGHTRCLVYEVVPNGSVESHLHGIDKRNRPLDWDARLKIALGAARGLAYLHEDSNPRVIHRDFKASNVLLEDDFTPKVSDFGLAREATEGSHHISTRVMGTFGYVAPEYVMTGHLLVKSDVYSYGVVLLELLSGRQPVDMYQPPGQDILVTWARPLLTSREGLQQLVDPTLAGSYEFDDMAKVAAIANMCVHPEVTQRPFMGEVVQALKLIYNDTDNDCSSQRESSAIDADIKVDFSASDSSWWNAGGLSPRLTYGNTTSFITMEYSSGPLDELENRAFSGSSPMNRVFLPIKHGNRSGPLRTVRSKPSFYRAKGSMSEHGLLSKRGWDEGASSHEASFDKCTEENDHFYSRK